MAPKNEHCDEINDRALEILLGLSITYMSVNTHITADQNEILKFPFEFQNDLGMTDSSSHDLSLKEVRL